MKILQFRKMPGKKQNAFANFMFRFKKEEAAKGRTMSMTELQVIAGNKWAVSKNELAFKKLIIVLSFLKTENDNFRATKIFG
jgi:hypothetical protein